MDREEALRVLNKNVELEKKRISLKRTIGSALKKDEKDPHTQMLLKKLGFSLDEKILDQGSFDFGIYLSCLMGKYQLLLLIEYKIIKTNFFRGKENKVVPHGT